jgi:AcrR family transcriptional regulator
MKETKEFILETAYEMFLCNNYEAVTLSEICKATKLTKGGVYHYFASKEELFKAVIDKYMIENERDNYIEQSNLLNLIQHMSKKIKERTARFKLSNPGNHNLMTRQFMSLLVSAYRYYPGFSAHGDKFFNDQIKLWKNAIDISIKEGVLRKDIDPEMMAMNFMSISTNVLLGMVQGSSSDFHKLIEQQLNELYNMLKIK